MTNNPRVPNMSNAHSCPSVQYLWGEIIHFSATILFNGSVHVTGDTTIAVKASKNLIDNLFTCHKDLTSKDNRRRYSPRLLFI